MASARSRGVYPTSSRTKSVGLSIVDNSRSTRSKRSVIFLFAGAEEYGLCGSAYYATNFPLKGEIVTINANADDEDGNLKEVRFYIDDSGVSSTNTFPYTYEWNTSEVAISNHTIKAEAIDDKNAKNENTITVS